MENNLFDSILLNSNERQNGHYCKGHIYRYRNSAYIDKRDNWNAEQTMVKMKKLSCDSCEKCGGLLELLSELVYPEDIIFPDNLKNDQLYILSLECHASGGYESSEETCYPKFIECKEEAKTLIQDLTHTLKVIRPALKVTKSKLTDFLTMNNIFDNKSFLEYYNCKDCYNKFADDYFYYLLTE